MARRILSLAWKEFAQLLRDRLMTLFIIAIPAAQLILLANAVSQSIHALALAVVDEDRTSSSRALARALDNIPELEWRFDLVNQAAAQRLLEGGKVAVVLVIPSGFEAALLAGKEVPLQVLIDGTNSLVGSVVRSLVEGAVADFLSRLTTSVGGREVGVEVSRIALYNPELKVRPFIIPAQMGFIVYQVTLIVASLVMAREKETGTLEQLLVTPLRPGEILLGKALAPLLVGVANFLLMYAVARRVFEVPMRGSFVLLAGLSSLFVLVEVAFGMLISNASQTQQQAMLYVFLLAMIDVALSGYLVPVQNMPVPFRLVASLSPLQHYLVILRTVMLKGAGLALLWPRVGALVGIGLGAALVAGRMAARSLE
jgi:ABC-2 type transport system permease protein